MTTDSVTIIQRYFDEVWSAGDERVQAQLIAPSYTGYWLIAGLPVRQGPAGHLAWLNAIRAAMPDLRYTIEDIVTGPEKAAARVTLAGTNSGPLAGRQPASMRPPSRSSSFTWPAGRSCRSGSASIAAASCSSCKSMASLY